MDRSYPSLKRWREANHLNQREAAKTLGVSQATYTQWELKTMYPRKHRLQAIMDKTHVPLEVLVGTE